MLGLNSCTRRSRLNRQLLALCCAVSWASLAAGQESPTPPENKSNGAVDSATITITGSRINRPGFTAPTPVSSVNAQDLENQGATNLASTLNQLPAFQASVTPAQTGLLSTVNGTNQLDLRGLGPSRTLVLVNGRRFVPSTALDSSVDINLLPVTAIQRIEVVTGGASAAWGSD